MVPTITKFTTQLIRRARKRANDCTAKRPIGKEPAGCSGRVTTVCMEVWGMPFSREFLVQPGRRQWHPTAVLLPGKSHGRRSLVGCSPWGREELDTTERLHFHFSLSCSGEGNGNPLQYSSLENPRGQGAWWAAVSGVAQSRTQLKRHSMHACIGTT